MFQALWTKRKNRGYYAGANITYKNVKAILKLQTVTNQATGWVWLTGHRLPTPELCPECVPLSAMQSGYGRWHWNEVLGQAGGGVSG